MSAELWVVEKKSQGGKWEPHRKMAHYDQLSAQEDMKICQRIFEFDEMRVSRYIRAEERDGKQ